MPICFSQNILFKPNEVYYRVDTLKGVINSKGIAEDLVLFSYYKFLNESTVYISSPQEEIPTLENTVNPSIDEGYIGSVKILKNDTFKIVYKKGFFYHFREIFMIRNKELMMIKYVPEGMLFFQWRKPPEHLLFILLE